ncbi:hypothetical protein [uncultured Tateyamaria sp.]|uniref:hypothetical protein n=1 Tax=Tateyamaria sp. 1078 TaxID=3417464 RepID=UPI002626CF0B|nr:hypothetical protein [uncultured Tateyamaria sp.]
MTQFEIGKLRVQAEVFDQMREGSRVTSGISKLPRHVHPLVRHFSGLYYQKLLSYDCTTNTWTRHAVDAQYRYIVKNDFKVAGPTANATRALLDSYVRASGLGGMNGFGQRLADMFGLHAVPVPLHRFRHWKPQYTFEISATVHYHVVRLTVPGQDPWDYALLAIPFDVQFAGERTYDCERKRGIDIDFDSILLPAEDLQVPDKAARQNLKPRLKWELKLSKKLLKYYKRELARNETDLASDPKKKGQDVVVRLNRESVARSAANVKRLAARLAAYD